ncbi:hypothetical protein PG997_015386 [Apiospora hydei]|uniref:Apple domain-containing protein n=1 Tax=Apiospora hydei TaxID=1337664 RepID=A0ABR1UQG7_9PEZI
MKPSTAWALLGLLRAMPAAAAAEGDDCPEGQRVTLSPGYTVEYRRGRYREGDVHQGINSHAECMKLCQVSARPVCSFHEPTKKCIVGTQCGKDIVREGVCYMEERQACLTEKLACQSEKQACTKREGDLQAEHAACQAQKGTLQAEGSGCLARESVLKSSNSACLAQKETLQAQTNTCNTQRTAAQNANTACQTSLQQCNARAGAAASSLHATRPPPAECGRKGWGQGWYNVLSGMKMGDCRKRCQAEAQCVAYSDDVFSDWGNCYLYNKQLSTLNVTPYAYWGTYAKNCA